MEGIRVIHMRVKELAVVDQEIEFIPLRKGRDEGFDDLKALVG